MKVEFLSLMGQTIVKSENTFSFWKPEDLINLQKELETEIDSWEDEEDEELIDYYNSLTIYIKENIL